MPIYSYKCHRCLLEFDERRSIDDRDKPAVCPYCKQVRATTRLLTKPAGIIIH